MRPTGLDEGSGDDEARFREPHGCHVGMVGAIGFLAHANVVRVFDVGRAAHGVFFGMEHVRGHSARPRDLGGH
jgi:hypothetical protein